MASPATSAPKKNKKQVFKLDSPFTATTLPVIADKDKDIILDMLCNLLTPIGRHRISHTVPSKGRSNRTLKRKRASEDPPPGPPPPPPALTAHLTIGLNATTRHLETLAASFKPSSTLDSTSNSASTSPPTPPRPRPLSIIVIPHPNPASSLIHAHLPTLVALSSAASSKAKLDKEKAETTRTRLIALPTSSEARLASALHLPRLSAIGMIEDAPGADALVDFVREMVGCVDVMWLGEAGLEGSGEAWRGVNVKTGDEKGEKGSG